MLLFICLFFPAVAAAVLFERFTHHRLSTRNYISLYALNVLFINFLCFGFKILFLRDGIFASAESGNITMNFAFAYLLVATVFAVAAALIEALLYKHVRIRVEDRENS